jgi:hypothetical protein
VLTTAPAVAQRPSDPFLLIPQTAPELDYVAVAEALPLPSGTTMGAPAAVAFDSKGHFWVLTRGPQPLFEFDANGTFIRAFGEGLFTRTHGLRFDRDGNIWVSDVGSHIVVKLNQRGEVLLTLGVKGEAGAWDEAAGSRKLNQPNDVAFTRDGDIFVVQGHTPGAAGDPRVLKFDRAAASSSWAGKARHRESSRSRTASRSTRRVCLGDRP